MQACEVQLPGPRFQTDARARNLPYVALDKIPSRCPSKLQIGVALSCTFNTKESE